jgi:hypothetical protein
MRRWRYPFLTANHLGLRSGICDDGLHASTGIRSTVMIAQMRPPVLIPRRWLLLFPLAPLLSIWARNETLAASTERELIASVERNAGLLPPLTLGIARVVLRPGASAFAATPNGARMIVVESGVLAVASASHGAGPLTSGELGGSAPAANESDELFVPAGTTVTFGSLEVARVRNPGARSVVALDVAVFREEPRPISRAFTTEDGISFQLLASASAAVAPSGRVGLALERLRLGSSSQLPADLSHGLTLAYVEAGSMELRPVGGEVYAARAAASTPYSMPGSLQPIAMGQKRGITAGGVIFLPVGAECGVVNVAARTADVLALSVREIA